MEFSHYFCTLTAAALTSYRKTGVSPIDTIRSALTNVDIDKNMAAPSAVMSCEIPEKGLAPYSEWLQFIMDQEGLTFSNWIQYKADGGTYQEPSPVSGLFCPQNNWIWQYYDEPASLFQITAEDFIDFINLQTEPDLFRQAVLSSASEYHQANLGSRLKDDELNAFLHSFEGRIFFEYNGDSLWYDIREKYVTDNRTILINDYFRERIYEDDDSYFVGKKTYGFIENSQRTSQLSLKLLHPSQKSGFQQTNVDDTAFMTELSKIESLAEKIESPFKGAFSTSKSLLQFRDKALVMKDLVEKCETTDQGREIITRQSDMLKLFENFGTRPDILCRLLACEVANVFGGMGSWNDQFIPEEYHLDYSNVSSDFYICLMEYRDGLLCSI